MMLRTLGRPIALAGLLTTALAVGTAEARVRIIVHHHHRHHHVVYRTIVVRPGGLLPGTYPADYDTPGYGNRSSLVNGNFGGYGIGWTYEGGPGWGYR